MAERGRIKQLRERLWRKDPRCHWCGVETILPIGDPRSFQSHTATIDHLRSKFDGDRTVPNMEYERRRVLACLKCNGERSAKEQSEFHAVNGTSKRKKSDGDAEGWRLNYPELATRPNLVEELKINERFRKRLFFAFNVMANVPKITDIDVATHVLAVLADYHWQILNEAYQEELEGKQFTLYNQFVSAYRNFRLNVLNQIQRGHKGTICKVKKPFYVRRDLSAT